MFIRNVRETEPRSLLLSLWEEKTTTSSKGKNTATCRGSCLHDANHRSVLHRHKYTDQTFGVFWTWLEKCVFKERQSHFLCHGFRF